MTAATEGTSKTYDALQNPNPEAIVVYCSDPRFQNAFDQFIAGELKLPKGQFIPLVVAGGAGVLAHPEKLPKEFKFMRDRLELYSHAFGSIRRVVLINHQDCKYYDSLTDPVFGFLGQYSQQTDYSRQDMPALAQVFRRRLSSLRMSVELYFARFADPAHAGILFDRIQA